MCTIPVQVSVIGSSGVISRETYEVARKVGYLIAKRGGVVICGGRGGVMEAVAKGATEGGGVAVAILPTMDKKQANPYCKIVITTSLGFARNAVVVSAGDAVIVIGGAVGTLSEVGLALAYGKPVIAVKGTGGVADMLAGREIDGYKVFPASSAEEAVELAFKLVSARE